jgi:putative ABC transport system ATP-binding protein
MAPIIYTENINKKFNTGKQIIHALNDVSIKVQPGTLTILRGRSGSGKTTLINTLGTLDRPDNGKIIFLEEEITKLSNNKLDSLRRKHMGFIFQSFALISLMSAFENVEFALRIAGFSSIEAEKRAKECIELVGLGKRMHHRPQEMSGGEQQRVAIARAIAHRPRIIFADEPTAELDTHNAIQIMKLFRDLVQNEGITIVMTTHDPNMMELGDYVITLEDGVVVSEKWNVEYKGEHNNDSM